LDQNKKNITFYDVWLRQHLSMRLFSYFYPLSHRPLACGRVQALNIFKTLICYLYIIRPQRIATRYKWTKLAYLLIYLTLLVRHVSMFRRQKNQIENKRFCRWNLGRPSRRVSLDCLVQWRADLADGRLSALRDIIGARRRRYWDTSVPCSVPIMGRAGTWSRQKTFGTFMLGLY